MLDLGEGLLDRAEVGRIGQQIPEPVPAARIMRRSVADLLPRLSMTTMSSGLRRGTSCRSI
jgi:hypothetical protein